MDVTPLLPEGHQVISAYGDGGFKITGRRYTGSVIIFPHITQAWAITSFEECIADEDTLAPLFQAIPLPEIILLGCGKDFLLVPNAIRNLFRNRGIALETMDTGAACRTYNILLSEGRKVAAALIAV